MTQSHSLCQAANCLSPDQLNQLRAISSDAERLFNQVTGIMNINDLLALKAEDRGDCLWLYEYIKSHHLVDFPPEQLKWEYVVNNTNNCFYNAVIAIFEPLNNGFGDF